ncbi:MAG: TonB-dependent receptor plug domain-containing protein [Sulfuricurvum sp.]|jgi:iron complex outermembrane receptor protein|uniref:TonB-dependent receptor plug domain-containing protein n=1 Tax=Sulfuricurvum sp. TaxID=2025608 RepID=UPI0025DFB39B|nr:TonB-dependent receptor [Sulfuricurvum sp.]MCK9373586.1 TonB-dependent receptor plug domain-containing protein [Sulfuricurvum sp.]
MKPPFIPLLLIPLFCWADGATTQPLQELIEDMASLTQSAKNQRANIDYLPYIMTLFEGNELAHAGASSLNDALTLVAGVNIASDNLSLFNPVFRGSNPVAYGQSKLIVDGVEVNDLFFDGYTAYLSMPIDMIKRLEIVHGPGSYSDGYSGYAGSIIVTTYKAEPSSGSPLRWFASAGGNSTRTMGGSYAQSHGDLSFSADVYTVRDNLSLPYGPDGLSNNLFGALNAPLSRSGDAPLQTDATMLSASLSKGAFFANGRFSTYRHGAGGGINYALASEGDHYNVDQWQLHAGTHYKVGNFTGKLQGSMIEDSFTSHALLAPPGLVFPSLTPPPTMVTYPNGFYGVHEAFIRTYRVSNTLTGTLYGTDVTFGIMKSHSSVLSEKTMTTNRDSGTGMSDYSQTLPFFNPNGSIIDLSTYLTFERVVTPSLSTYASLTLDRRNGLTPQLDPRIAAVYTLDPANLIKFSISHAHRNPSWQEMFTLNNKARWGNPDLRAESVWAFETQLIHNFGIDHTLSFNLFDLRNDDQIYLKYNTSLARYEYVNGSKSTIQGVETEWRKRYSTFSFYAAYTHLLTKDGNGIPLSTPQNMARGYISYDLDTSWYGSLAGQWQSNTPRFQNDPRETLKEIKTVDATIGYKLPSLHSEIQLSVKNIFDASQRYPSPAGTYNDDYPAPGRTFLVTVRGTF